MSSFIIDRFAHNEAFIQDRYESKVSPIQSIPKIEIYQ
ncbi:hypothetical protein D3OALGA1CA_5112 [Olavius algarvensis associated proteobacterium Delta 3]|nr:hypothetical protein D3OALGA1CA_5112 [Olavius algarvensis associated proteobacterium Delta 3]